MFKDKFEVLKNNLYKAHICESREASDYRAGTKNPIFVVQKLTAIGVAKDGYSLLDCVEKIEYTYGGDNYESLDELRGDMGSYEAFTSALSNDSVDENIVSYGWEDRGWFLTKEEAEKYKSNYKDGIARIYIKSLHMSYEFKSLLEGVAMGEIVHVGDN